jgi:hypothetical protein
MMDEVATGPAVDMGDAAIVVPEAASVRLVIDPCHC